MNSQYGSCQKQDIGLFPYFTIGLSISNKVHIQKRIVYDILMMFGDVGGLNDFAGLFLATVFGYFSEDLMIAKMTDKLFH